jgi:hypothetical protein
MAGRVSVSRDEMQVRWACRARFRYFNRAGERVFLLVPAIAAG